MHLRHLELLNWRNYESLAIDLPAGLTAVIGANGQGKSNLVEAVGYLATLKSFRGAPTDALVRAASDTTVVRAEVLRGERELLLEAELVAGKRTRMQVNKQRLQRTGDLVEAVVVTVFSPDDLELIKGGPSERRGYLDDALSMMHPRNDRVRSDLDKILKQRNALLKQSRGRLNTDAALTLDVWDSRLAEAGEAWGDLRAQLTDRLGPRIQGTYRLLATAETDVVVTYDPPWRRQGLAAALAAGRDDDVRRGVSLIGPHRDDLEIHIAGLPSRTHASQGEQRTTALALRLAVHLEATEVHGVPPILLLDDVFSELDPMRSRALLDHLPPGQTLLTSAGPIPDGAHPELVVRIEDGGVIAAPDQAS